MGLFGGQHKPERSVARKPSAGNTNRTFTDPRIKGGFLDDCKGFTRKSNDPKTPRGGSPKGKGK